MNWIYAYPFGRDVDRQIFEQTLSFVTVKFVFQLRYCQTTKGKKRKYVTIFYRYD